MTIIDQRTSVLNLPLPHPVNELDADILRLREALETVAVILAAKADTETVNADFAALIDQAPQALNTLREFADAIAGDGNFAVTMNNKIDQSNESARRSAALSVMAM